MDVGHSVIVTLADRVLLVVCHLLVGLLVIIVNIDIDETTNDAVVAAAR